MHHVQMLEARGGGSHVPCPRLPYRGPHKVRGSRKDVLSLAALKLRAYAETLHEAVVLRLRLRKTSLSGRQFQNR